MKNLCISVLIVTLLVASVFVSKADTKQDIEKASKKGQVVFLIVTEKGNPKNQEALGLAQKAQKLYSKSAIVELDRSNTENSQLVKKYRVSGAPVPLILVVGMNGYVSGGDVLENLTAEGLSKMVPSATEETVLKAINENNSVFVIFTKKSEKGSSILNFSTMSPESKNKKQLEACQTACQTMGNKAVTVSVDVDDSKEKLFIEKFNPDKNAAFPVTYVLNAQGQVTSMLVGNTEANTLVAAAKKKVGGCGTGSSCGTSCGPKK